MTNTYSGDPSTSEKDHLRFLLSDTKEPWLFTDEEIQWAYDEHKNIWQAAEELAMKQAASYTDRKDKTVGPLSIKYGQIADRWFDLAEKLRKRSSRNAGAVAITTQRSRRPYFRLGMMDNPTAAHGDQYELLGGDPRDLTDYGD